MQNANFLALGTPNTKKPTLMTHETCQTSKIFGICYGIILSMARYGHMFYLFFVYFVINFLSPLVKFLYFSLSLSISLIAIHPLTIKFILSPL